MHNELDDQQMRAFELEDSRRRAESVKARARALEARRAATQTAPAAKEEEAKPVEAIRPEQKSDRGIVASAVHHVSPIEFAGGMLDNMQETMHTLDLMTAPLQEAQDSLFERFPHLEALVDIAQDAIPAVKGGKLVGDFIDTHEIGDDKDGSFARGMGNFLTGFIGAGKVLKGANLASKVGVFGDDAIRSAISVFFGQDGHEANFVNFLEQYGLAPDMLNDLLGSDEEDGEVEAKFKAALTDAGLTAVGTGLIRMFRGIRGLKSTKGAEQMAEAASEVTRAKEILDSNNKVLSDVLGAVDGDEVVESADDIFVNWARIDTPEDVENVLKKMVQIGKGRIRDAQRGVRSHAMTKEAAENENAFQILLNRRKGDALNAEESYALRQLWVSSGEKMVELARLVRSDAATPAHKIALRKMLTIHNTIQEQVLGARTETARALNQWRIPAGSFDEQLTMLDELLTRTDMDRGLEQIAEGITDLVDMARMDRASEFAFATAKMERLAKAGKLTSDATRQLVYASLLSSPVTHMRNAISNTSMIGLSLADRGMAAGIGKALGKQYVPDAEVAAMATGFVHGARRFWTLGSIMDDMGRQRTLWQRIKTSPGMEAARTGQSSVGMARFAGEAPGPAAGAGEEIARALAPDLDDLNMFGRAAHWAGHKFDSATRAPTGGLAASDEFFKLAGRRAELEALATRKAYTEFTDGILDKADIPERIARILSDPDEYTEMMATRFAQRMTFTNKPMDTQAWRAARDVSKIPFFGRIVLPFTRTPYNIAIESLERMPVTNLLSKRWRAEFMAGGARRDVALGKLAVGNMALITALDMAMNGQVTGDLHSGRLSPSDATRDQGRREGKESMSLRFNLGPDADGKEQFLNVPFRGLDPFSFPFAVAGNVADLMLLQDFEDPDTNWTHLMTTASMSIASLFTTQNYMMGLAGLFRAIDSPTQGAVPYVRQILGMPVPTIIGQGARTIDPTVREAYDLWDTALNKFGFGGILLEPKVNFRGDVQEYDTDLPAALQFISPSRIVTKTVEPGDALLRDIGLVKGVPGSTAHFHGIPIDLKTLPHIYTDYKIQAGKLGRQPLRYGNGELSAAPIGTNDYTSVGQGMAHELDLLAAGKHPYHQAIFDLMNEEEKVAFVNKVIDVHRKAARDLMWEKYPELRAEINSRASDREPSVLNPGSNVQLQGGFR